MRKLQSRLKKRKSVPTDDGGGKTYHIGSSFILTVIFITIFLLLHMDRMSKYSNIVNSAKNYTSEIRELERRKKFLYSEIETYSSPGRSLEIGLELGHLKPRNENKDDVIYIEIKPN